MSHHARTAVLSFWVLCVCVLLLPHTGLAMAHPQGAALRRSHQIPFRSQQQSPPGVVDVDGEGSDEVPGATFTPVAVPLNALPRAGAPEAAAASAPNRAGASRFFTAADAFAPRPPPRLAFL